jgi:hypothetical protein
LEVDVLPVHLLVNLSTDIDGMRTIVVAALISIVIPFGLDVVGQGLFH